MYEIEIDRKYPKGKRLVGGLNSYRAATRYAAGGSMERTSVTQAVFIASDCPMVSTSAMLPSVRRAMLNHSTRLALR